MTDIQRLELKLEAYMKQCTDQTVFDTHASDVIKDIALLAAKLEGLMWKGISAFIAVVGMIMISYLLLSGDIAKLTTAEHDYQLLVLERISEVKIEVASLKEVVNAQ